MLVHPEFKRILTYDHVEQLRADAARRRTPAPSPRPVADTSAVQLRLCRVTDDPQLERLEQLAERPLPAGRLIVAEVCDRIVAALPLAGGTPLADPFERTSHILPLLRLRAAQLREPKPRRGVIPRYVNLIRGSTHA